MGDTVKLPVGGNVKIEETDEQKAAREAAEREACLIAEKEEAGDQGRAVRAASEDQPQSRQDLTATWAARAAMRAVPSTDDTKGTPSAAKSMAKCSPATTGWPA